jgi:hypothetical protein
MIDALFDFDVNWTSRHVVASCGTNIGPIVFISVRDDHARDRECADPLFGPISTGTGGRPADASATKYDFPHVEARY